MLLKGTTFQTFFYRLGDSDVPIFLKASCLENAFKSLYKRFSAVYSLPVMDSKHIDVFSNRKGLVYSGSLSGLKYKF